MNRKNAEIRDPKVGNNPGTLKAEALETSGKRSGSQVRGSAGHASRLLSGSNLKGLDMGYLNSCRGNYSNDISSDLLSRDDSESYIVNKFAILRKHVSDRVVVTCHSQLSFYETNQVEGITMGFFKNN